jgi:hypothetical protein
VTLWEEVWDFCRDPADPGLDENLVSGFFVCEIMAVLLYSCVEISYDCLVSSFL